MRDSQKETTKGGSCRLRKCMMPRKKPNRWKQKWIKVALWLLVLQIQTSRELVPDKVLEFVVELSTNQTPPQVQQTLVPASFRWASLPWIVWSAQKNPDKVCKLLQVVQVFRGLISPNYTRKKTKMLQVQQPIRPQAATATVHWSHQVLNARKMH